MLYKLKQKEVKFSHVQMILNKEDGDLPARRAVLLLMTPENTAGL